MRITNKMIGNNLAYNIQSSIQKLSRTQQNIATGQRVLRPSDDPTVVSRLLNLQGTLEASVQYVRNINDGLSYLYAADVALGTATDILHDANELAVQGASGTLTKEDMAYIGARVNNMIDNMVDVANTDLGGKYIFAGKLNRLPPFERNGDTITYRGDFQDIFREISFGTGYKVSGPGVGEGEPTGPFGGAVAAGPLMDDGTQYYGVFGTLFQLRDALNSGKADEVSSSLERVQQEVDHLLQERVKVGARTRHFESVKDQLLGQEIRLKQIELDIGGVHIEKASIDLAQQSLTYQAALGSSAQILQTSLLHFLK